MYRIVLYHILFAVCENKQTKIPDIRKVFNFYLYKWQSKYIPDIERL